MGPGEFEPPEASDLQKLFPDFEVKRLVGRGGMGAVYEAFQRDLERQVALKILPPETADDLEFQERFRREAATLAKLDHPNIVKLLDYGEREGYFYFIMEYVEGADLSGLMSDGEFSPQEVLTIVGQVCDALDYCL
jgi:serine/threonine protein kinase